MKLIIILTLSSFVLSCASDDISEIEEEIDNDQTACEITGPPEFISGPILQFGTTSADISFRTNIPSNTYYIISSSKLDNETPEDIKTKAISGSASLVNGVYESPCNSLTDNSTITIDNLPTKTQLYVYLISESYVSDTLLQNDLLSFSFTTHERIGVNSFQSSVKGHEALYVRYMPNEEALKYPKKKEYPLIVFLGGNGEVAPEGEIAVIKNGSLPKYIADGNNIPFILIAPEHTQNEWKTDFIHEVVEYAKEQYAVDPTRIIITGMSGGGIGTIQYAIDYPEVPAAIVPISGEGDTTKACNLASMAVWAFHNTNDPQVPTSGSMEIIDAVNQCSPGPEKEVHLTIFQDEGHNAWIRVYNPSSSMWSLDPTVEPINIYDWMYNQSK